LGKWEIRDLFKGSGEHDFVLTLPLATGARVQLYGGNEALARWTDGTCLRVRPLSFPDRTRVQIRDGWVSPGWYLKEKAPRYVLRWQARVPVETRLLLEIESDAC
jgi:hypothetical protein